MLDQGVPRDAAGGLRDLGYDCIHTGEVGMSTAGDYDILSLADGKNAVVATLDSGSTRFSRFLVRRDRPLFAFRAYAPGNCRMRSSRLHPIRERADRRLTGDRQVAQDDLPQAPDQRFPMTLFAAARQRQVGRPLREPARLATSHPDGENSATKPRVPSVAPRRGVPWRPAHLVLGLLYANGR